MVNGLLEATTRIPASEGLKPTGPYLIIQGLLPIVQLSVTLLLLAEVTATFWGLGQLGVTWMSMSSMADCAKDAKLPVAMPVQRKRTFLLAKAAKLTVTSVQGSVCAV